MRIKTRKGRKARYLSLVLQTARQLNAWPSDKSRYRALLGEMVERAAENGASKSEIATATEGARYTRPDARVLARVLWQKSLKHAARETTKSRKKGNVYRATAKRIRRGKKETPKMRILRGA